MTKTLIVTLLLGCCFVLPASAADDSNDGAVLFKRECARCHGSEAQGGNGGEYPRLAGMSAGYIQQQLGSFRNRKRRNKPMLPIFKAGRLTDAAIEAVSRYLSELAPPTPEAIGIAELADADLELGEEFYVTDCALCHGHDGSGKPGTDNPPLVSQHSRYIGKQMADFRNRKRWHEYGEALFEEAETDELEAMVGYILHLNFHPPALPDTR